MCLLGPLCDVRPGTLTRTAGKPCRDGCAGRGVLEHRGAATVAARRRPWRDWSVDIPETRYASAPDGTSIAYRVLGDGPGRCGLSAAGIWSNVELMWDDPDWAPLSRTPGHPSVGSRCSTCGGSGCPIVGPSRPSIELQRDDIAAVMDAVGIADCGGVRRGPGGHDGDAVRRDASGIGPGRSSSTHPSRRRSRHPDFPSGRAPTSKPGVLRAVRAGRGHGPQPRAAGPFRRPTTNASLCWWARFERLVASPSAYEELARSHRCRRPRCVARNPRADARDPSQPRLSATTAGNDSLRTHVSEWLARWRPPVAEVYTRFGAPAVRSPKHMPRCSWPR